MANKDQLAEMLMGFIKDKPACLAQITESLQQVSTIGRGMDRLQEQLEGDEEVDLQKAMLALVKSMRKLATHTQITGMVALVYVDGTQFDVDVALLLNRLGKGGEALKTIFQNKMKGGG